MNMSPVESTVSSLGREGEDGEAVASAAAASILLFEASLRVLRHSWTTAKACSSVMGAEKEEVMRPRDRDCKGGKG